MADGIESDKVFPPRSRYCRLANLPRSDGMAPARSVRLRLRTERNERLPIWGVISPWRGIPGRTRAVTRRRCRRPHETPTQLQKDTFSVQPWPRMPWGSDTWALNARSEARSSAVSLLGGAGDGVAEATVTVADISKQYRD
ncbi:hypothetical protein U9M48_001395 [Paspalum notatum var. saurae]|uniref:Uncharacterized protein n=1 Tax=Paspalum notatum var. saurae TaxID=547442 RepID=A0AAQ3SCW9_PASNO